MAYDDQISSDHGSATVFTPAPMSAVERLWSPLIRLPGATLFDRRAPPGRNYVGMKEAPVRRVTKLAAVLATVTLGLAACGSSDGDTATPEASGGAAKSDIKVGLAYDIGGRGDQSFNDSAAVGLDKAKSEFGVETKELEAGSNETDAQKEERLRLLAQGGYNPVVAVGFAYAVALGKVAKEFPDVQFGIIDDASLKEPNVTSLTFAEEQGSFLVGTIAAQASKTKNVGFIGGVNTPLIEKFEAGFTAGAKAVTPDITVQVKYLTQPPDFTGFSSPDKGKTAAEGMLDAKADVIYAAAGGSGSGAFDAVAAAKALAIGVDSDQYKTAAAGVKEVVLTSMLKQVDTAVYAIVKAAVDKKPLTGEQVFDLKSEGIGYSTSNSIVEPFTAKTDEFKEKIISGEITVPKAP
jgi:basic membrane protein A and related proteins